MQYKNPILYEDLSDPDVIRVSDRFYMTASSFTYVPGLPVYCSKDLAHWTLVGNAASRLPDPTYSVPRHGCGIWAPSIRFARGRFYIYACMPDEGLFAWTAVDPSGEWECRLVKKVTGWIDPCPLFTQDGAWLVHGFAASRVGINNVLYVHEMSPDGFEILDKGRRVYDGAEHGDVTVEGPKFYFRGGRYWILCPAGGVRTGYQLALRADTLYGPYERRVVLSQGNTPVNGPHQGAWFDDGHGREWFVHFQDVGAYGRVPHLQPVVMRDGWPVMGSEGEPVPGGDTFLPARPAGSTDDGLFADGPGPAWQWQANPDPTWYAPLRPGLRLNAVPADSLYAAGNFLSRRMPARDFDMDIYFSPSNVPGCRSGAGVMGREYVYAAYADGAVRLFTGSGDERETQAAAAAYEKAELLLRLCVRDGTVSFFFGPDAFSLAPLGGAYPLSPGGWTGARPGIFCIGTGGHADFSRVTVGTPP